VFIIRSPSLELPLQDGKLLAINAVAAFSSFIIRQCGLLVSVYGGGQDLSVSQMKGFFFVETS
jgi:hypothetical protein